MSMAGTRRETSLLVPRQYCAASRIDKCEIFKRKREKCERPPFYTGVVVHEKKRLSLSTK